MHFQLFIYKMLTEGLPYTGHGLKMSNNITVLTRSYLGAI